MNDGETAITGGKLVVLKFITAESIVVVKFVVVKFIAAEFLLICGFNFFLGE
jgi:hypothetical protein